MESWVYIHICTDAYTNSKKGVGPEMDSLENTQCVTHGNPYFHVTMQSGLEQNYELMLT